MKKIKLLAVMLLCFFAFNSNAQEVAPLKTFEYSISLTQLKTQSQVDAVLSKLNNVKGISNCSLILIDYELNFECTNHDMSKYDIMSVVKQILSEENIEINKINYNIIDNEKSK